MNNLTITTNKKTLGVGWDWTRIFKLSSGRATERHQTYDNICTLSEPVCRDIMFCNRSESALNFEKKYACTKKFRKIKPLYSCLPSQDRHAHINFIGYFVCQLRGVPSWVQMKPLGLRNRILMFSRMFIRIIYLQVKCPNALVCECSKTGMRLFTLLYVNLTTLTSLHAAEHQNLISEA